MKAKPTVLGITQQEFDWCRKGGHQAKILPHLPLPALQFSATNPVSLAGSEMAGKCLPNSRTPRPAASRSLQAWQPVSHPGLVLGPPAPPLQFVLVQRRGDWR